MNLKDLENASDIKLTLYCQALGAQTREFRNEYAIHLAKTEYAKSRLAYKNELHKRQVRF